MASGTRVKLLRFTSLFISTVKHRLLDSSSVKSSESMASKSVAQPSLERWKDSAHSALATICDRMR